MQAASNEECAAKNVPRECEERRPRRTLSKEGKRLIKKRRNEKGKKEKKEITILMLAKQERKMSEATREVAKGNVKVVSSAEKKK